MRPKFGTEREDGKMFYGYTKYRLKDGTIKCCENWLCPQVFMKTKLKNRKALKEWAKKNKTHIQEYQKKYRSIEKNRARISENFKAWRSKNRSKLLKYASDFRKNNPEKMAEFNYLRRARLNKSKPLSRDEMVAMKNIYRFSALCSKILKTPYHVDHVVPISRGGIHHPSNLRVIPAKINIQKGAKLNEIALA